MEWASPSSYDFTLNTSSLGIDRTVDLLVMSYNQMKVEKNNIKETKSNPDDIKGGLKKVTDTVVDDTKIENGFVKAFLRKNGETVEEAKARLKEEEKRRREKQRKYLKSTEEIQKKLKVSED